MRHALAAGRRGVADRRRFKTGSQRREMPREFGAWSTVHNRFRQRRDAGVFEALLDGVIAEAAKRGEVGLFLVSVPALTPRPKVVTAPTSPQKPSADQIVRGLYDQLGGRRPGTTHIRDALKAAGLPCSDGTYREARQRVEAKEGIGSIFQGAWWPGRWGSPRPMQPVDGIPPMISAHARRKHP
ncbi:transposase [Streptomyces sp. NPDC056231]|uniref:transposase n=1 Tax=Streptomyces sp. NPDC056231 TaxID=3345755 RepID=UPI003AAD0DEF